MYIKKKKNFVGFKIPRYTTWHLIKFKEFVEQNRWNFLCRLGSIFVVENLETKEVMLISPRPGPEFIVRIRIKRFFLKMMTAIIDDKVRFMRYDPKNGLKDYNVDDEPEWINDYPKKSIEELEQEEE